MTTCATCSAPPRSSTAASSLPPERHDPVAAPRKSAQSRQRRRFPFLQLRQDLVHHPVQAVGGLGLGQPRFLRQSFCDLRLLHAPFLYQADIAFLTSPLFPDAHILDFTAL